jgi:signal recognition particle subunit SRP54
VIVDTAGRLAIDEQMMDEIARIKKAIAPQETLFVVDAMTGQDAVNTAKAFNERLNIDGVVLTKLDGDARGGAALSIRSVVDKPIKFIGTGEKMEAWTSSTRTAWPAASWAWATWSRWWSARRSSSTSSRPAS